MSTQTTPQSRSIFARTALLKWATFALILPMSIAASKSFSTDASYPANPISSDNTVFVSSEGIHAYSVGDLRILWSALVGEHTFEPVIYQRQILVGSSRGLFALHSQSGNVLWHIEGGSEIFSPVISNGIAFAGSRNGTLLAIDAASGEEIWRATFPGWVYSPAVFADVVITGGQNAILWAVNSSDGTRRWSQTLPGELVFGPVAGNPGSVLVTTFAADLIAYESSTGMLRWRTNTPTANMPPVVSNGSALLAGFDGRLRKIDLQEGKLDWETRLSGRLSTPRRTNANRILVSNDEGEVFTLNDSTGQAIGNGRVAGTSVGSPFPQENQLVQFSRIRSSAKLLLIPNSLPANRQGNN